MKTKKIAVVMGGPSSEREISLRTGQAILNALQEKGYNAIGIDLDPATFYEALKNNKIEIVFNAIHGKYGEDGILQGFLDLLNIPYTGSNLTASALAMDKIISKRMFITGDIPTAKFKFYSLKENNDIEQIHDDILKTFGQQCVLKANSQGSSLGVNIVKKEADLKNAIWDCFKYDDQILVEQFIQGREFTVSILSSEENDVLPIVEIVPNSGSYDYHSKYTVGATNYIVPAQISESKTKEIQMVALKTYNILGCSGAARVDIMVDENENPYVLEVNTIPGMTATSLLPKAALSKNISFPDLCEKILLSSIK
ncbi:D-alanine--D-alanine ligase [Selenomonadales bacterium OttesenSCG-928-I06]|nr:D-alanine--D-alanine ligase [Selenomonadales bacterium OttesenSCG-928-I06]